MRTTYVAAQHRGAEHREVEARLRYDRVLPETRLLAAVIVPFLVVAFALLYTSNALAYVFIAGIAGLFLSLLTIEWCLHARTREGVRRTDVAAIRN